jgi:hypothetical protein
MHRDHSEESINFDCADMEIEQNIDKEHNVVIFDWDDTLFCTKYLNMHEVDYKALFSEQKSIEEVSKYLSYELQSLEDVMNII